MKIVYYKDFNVKHIKTSHNKICVFMRQVKLYNT